MGGHGGHGGHHGGGGHHHGGGGWRGGWGGFYNPGFYTYDDSWISDAPTVPAASFYRGYVISPVSTGYSVSKAGSATVLKVFKTYSEARAFVDTIATVSGMGGFMDEGLPKLMTVGAIAFGAYVAFFREPKHRSRR